MFNFINTLVLPLLAAALIPLILHLLNRKKLKVIPFSSVRFLKELQNKRIRQIKLYQILIILLRMLFIIFLVLAFARPTIRHFFTSGSGSARTTAVIILDNSYSMQTQQGMQSFFSRAKEGLKTILQSFEKHDNVTVLIPRADSLRIFTISPNTPLPWHRLKASDYSPDFSTSVFAAARIFRRFPNYNRELYFITDEQISNEALSDSARQVLKHLPAKMYIINAAAGFHANNVSIDTAAVTDRFIELRKPLSVAATLQNHTAEEKQVTLSLFDGSRRLAMQAVPIPSQHTRRVLLHFSPHHTGFFPLKLEIDDDDLLIDNTYYLSLFIPEKIPVLYVQDQTPLELREALNTLSAQTNLQIKLSNYDRWYGEPLSRYRLLVLTDPPHITQTFLLHLKQFLAGGKNVILISGSHSTPTDYNNLSKELFNQNIFRGIVKAANAQQFFSPTVTMAGRSILNDLFSQKPRKIVWPPFYLYFKTTPVGKILMRFQNGDPFLMRVSAAKNGSLYLFTAGLTMPYSRFPISGIFLPFLHRILSLASQNERRHTQFIVGQPFTVYLNKAAIRGNFRLYPPQGEPLTVIPKETPRGLRFDFDGFDRPGHYQIFQDKTPIRLFAVNLSQKEWRQPYVPFNRLRSDVRIIGVNALSAKKLKTARSGYELWPFFLLLALLALFAEMLLIRKLEGRPEGVER